MPGIGIITNPNSRRNRKNPERVERLGYIMGDDHDRHELTQHPDDIVEVAERFKDHGVEILALNGGDGTNHVTLTTFIEVYGDEPLPKIAFLRGGTMNTISNAVGVKGTPGTILLNVSEKYYLGQPFEVSERRILRVEYDGQTVYGFIFGNGLIYGFLDAYYSHSNPSPWVAFTTLVKALGSVAVNGEIAQRMFAPFRAEITVDGETWEQGDHTAVVASSIEQIGLGFRPFVRCRQDPQKFNLLGIRANAVEFAMQLPRIRMGKPPSSEKVRSELAHEVVFTSDQTINFTIDGDLHQANGPVRMTTGPKLEIILQ